MDETVLLIDSKERQYLVKLVEGGSFRYHEGVLPHGEIAGAAEGTTLTASGGGRLLVLRPRLADFVLRMPRGAQVVYPKDVGPILVWADIAPGMTVVEGGTGSGALAIALARAVGPAGRVVSVERREDHAAHAEKIIRRWFGEIPRQLELRLGDVEEAIAEVRPGRVVLDVPEPWHAVDVSAGAQPGGALFCAYLPTIPQVSQLVEAMRETDAFGEIEVSETFHREWNVRGRSVRPSHQMVGHTGFLVVARRVGSAVREEGLAEDAGGGDPDATGDAVAGAPG